MQTESANLSAVAVPKRRFWIKLVWFAAVSITATIVFLVSVVLIHKPKPPIQVPLGDGRILQIEAVSFGTHHKIGHDPVLGRFMGWMPNKLMRLLHMTRWENKIDLERPGLVVWVNAIDAVTRTNLDCQSIRLEFVDKNGDLFGQKTSSWFGGQDF